MKVVYSLPNSYVVEKVDMYEVRRKLGYFKWYVDSVYETSVKGLSQAKERCAELDIKHRKPLNAF